MRILAALTTAVIVALTGAAQAALPAAATTASDETVPGKLLLMLDASGSMKAKDPSGLTKIEAAKKALTGVVGALPDSAQVGLRVYGAKVDGKGKPTPAACADTQLIHPIAPLDKPKLTSTIAAIKALGETPIAHSLEEALKDLGTEGKRNIVLVSDGEESCVPDPCPTVKKLTAAGVDLQIDTVGFGVNAKARTQLQCIADAGKGTYYDAKDASALESSLTKLSTRATRPFAFTGKPITGVDVGENAQIPPGAPELSPGQFTDTLAASKDTWRAYTIKRTLPESTLHVSFATKPATRLDTSGERQLEQLDLKLIAPNGTECVDTWTNNGSGVGITPVATVTGRLHGQTPEDERQSPECAGKETYTVLVQRTGGMAKTQTEISVIEEPRVTNLKSLPPAPDDYPDEIELPKGEEKTVTGGLAFSDAAEITSGTWVDTLVPGETLVYRVKVEHGQTVRFTANGPTGGFRYPEVDYDSLWIDGRAFAPDREAVGDSMTHAGSFSKTYGESPKSVTSSAVTYLNRFRDGTDHIQSSSMSGWYYYTVGIGTTDLGEVLAGQPIKVAFTVKVEGEPSNAVKYDGTPPTDPHSPTSKPEDAAASKADDTAGSDEDTPLALWGGLGLGLLALIGVGGYVARRQHKAGAEPVTENQGHLR